MSGPVALVGPTASGKSSVGLAAAKTVAGTEILAADSMQVYVGMDIGTAKPTSAEQAEVPHHLVDLVDPSVYFSVSQYAEAFTTARADVEARGGEVLVVGGTGLYVQSVVDDFEIPPTFPEIRAELEATFDEGAHWAELQRLDPLAASRMEATNQRRVIRALEVCRGTGRPFSSFGPGVDAYAETDFTLIALDWPRPLLDERIEARYVAMIEAGLVGEVERLLAGPKPIGTTAARALGYAEIIDHLGGNRSLDDAVQTAVARTRRFARRQQRWFRRDRRIRWIELGGENSMEDAVAVVVEALQAQP